MSGPGGSVRAERLCFHGVCPPPASGIAFELFADELVLDLTMGDSFLATDLPDGAASVPPRGPTANAPT
jgi:hypothetical protein